MLYVQNQIICLRQLEIVVMSIYDINNIQKTVSEANRIILKDFYQYMRSKDLKSEHHIVNLLLLLISLDKFYGPDIPFTSIKTKEQILKFLDHRQQKDG